MTIHNPVPFAYDYATPQEKLWYDKLTERTGLRVRDVITCHLVMYNGSNYPQTVRQNDFFHNHSKENRALLLGLMERVQAGEHLPNF